MVPQKDESVFKSVLRTSLLIIFGVVFILIAPFFLFWFLSVNADLSSRTIIVIDIFYVLLVIFVARQFVFKERK